MPDWMLWAIIAANAVTAVCLVLVCRNLLSIWCDLRRMNDRD